MKESLPDTAGYYLVNVLDDVANKRAGSVEKGELFKTVKQNQIDGKMSVVLKFHDYVTHWMPLPEPPIF